MKKKLLLFIIVPFFTGCLDFDFTRPIGLQFRWFENTPAWPLAQAVKDEDTAQIRYLVQEKHIDVNYQTRSKYGTTLLHLAVANGLFLSTQALLEQGAKINIWDSLGWQPLGSAFYDYAPIKSSTNRLKIIELLLKHGANPNDYKWYKHGDSSKYVIGRIPLANGTIDIPTIQLMMRYGAKIDLKIKYSLESGDSIPYYPVWENIGSRFEENWSVIKYLVVDLHMSIPDTVVYGGGSSIENIKTHNYLDYLKNAKLKGSKEKEARKTILAYLRQIGYPKKGALRLFE